MRYSGRMKGKCHGTRGSSMVYVIFLIVLLSIFSCGYMAVSSYNMQAAAAANGYMEAQLTAKTIHTSFSEAVSSGNSSAMNCLWERFEEDVQRVREEFDQVMEEEELQEGGLKEEGGAGEALEDSEQEERFERYLRHSLGNKEYVICGTSSHESQEEIRVEITLKAKPMEETACVHTRVECNGYRFSMKADIVFNNSDGAAITVGRPGRGKASDESTVYLEGNGVYRYYEDEDDDRP